MKKNLSVEDLAYQFLHSAKQGNINSAGYKLNELMKHNPDNHAVQYAMGVICVLKKDYDSALPFLDKAISLYPGFAKAWYYKALAHQNKKEIPQSIKAYRVFIEKGNSTDPKVHEAHGIVKNFANNIMKKYNLKLDDFLKAVDLFYEADNKMHAQNWEEALSLLRQAVAINPGLMQAHVNIGFCLAKLQRVKEALETFDYILKIDPKNKSALINKNLLLALIKGSEEEPHKPEAEYIKPE